MRFKQIIFFILFFVVFALGCGRSENPKGSTELAQESCGFAQNESGQRVSLKSNITFLVSPETPKEYIPAIKTAMKVWNTALGRNIFSLQEGERVSSDSLDGVNSIQWITAWPDDKSDQQADTKLNVQENYVERAHIKINAKHYAFSTTLEKNTLDVESLFVHELGHVLGLKHEVSTDSVMYPRLSLETRRTELSRTDISHLKCEY